MPFFLLSERQQMHNVQTRMKVIGQNDETGCFPQGGDVHVLHRPHSLSESRNHQDKSINYSSNRFSALANRCMLHCRETKLPGNFVMSLFREVLTKVFFLYQCMQLRIFLMFFNKVNILIVKMPATQYPNGNLDAHKRKRS
jgi:hypothetical protein